MRAVVLFGMIMLVLLPWFIAVNRRLAPVWICPRVQSCRAASRMQKWGSQAGSSSCMRQGARFHSLQHRLEGPQQQGNDYLVSLADYTPTLLHDLRVLRLLGTGPQQDGVHR